MVTHNFRDLVTYIMGRLTAVGMKILFVSNYIVSLPNIYPYGEVL